MATGKSSGANHTQWLHPARRHPIAVPNSDLIINAVAEAILTEAEG